jgi:hypothetical protein
MRRAHRTPLQTPRAPNLWLESTGSSTTGLAAVMYGRKCIGIDTELKYLDLSVKQFEKLFKQKKLEGWV